MVQTAAPAKMVAIPAACFADTRSPNHHIPPHAFAIRDSALHTGTAVLTGAVRSMR